MSENLTEMLAEEIRREKSKNQNTTNEVKKQNLTDEVKRENQKKLALGFIEQYQLSPELASLASQSENPESVAKMLAEEVRRENRKALDADLQNQLDSLAQAEAQALAAGNIAKASAAKRQAYRLREIHKNRS